MYIKWASQRNYSSQILDEEVEGGGCKNCTLEIMGKYAYDLMKNETGIHRFTRVSPYGAGTKIHTSFISTKVTPVLPKVDCEIQSEKDIKIDPGDLRIEFMKARGPGGQHVNKTESAVRIVHLPTRIIVSVSTISRRA